MSNIFTTPGVSPTTVRCDSCFNANWVQANPELMGRSVEDFLATYPFSDWKLSIEPGNAPGIAFRFVARRKGA